jgi:hypothetical protein
MVAAQNEYPAFIASLESGSPEAVAEGQVRADLDSGDRAYLALSSLAYAYYRLAERAAEAPDQSPVLIARLESWNAMLSQLYERSGDNPALRQAVREAAEDLHRRAPRLETPCTGTGNHAADCHSTGLLLRTLREVDASTERHGVRGALTQLLNRLRGEEAKSP